MGDDACLQLGGDNDGSTPKNSYWRLEKFRVRMDRIIGWRKPPPEWLKLNIDGNMLENHYIYIEGGRSNQR